MNCCFHPYTMLYNIMLSNLIPYQQHGWEKQCGKHGALQLTLQNAGLISLHSHFLSVVELMFVHEHHKNRETLDIIFFSDFYRWFPKKLKWRILTYIYMDTPRPWSTYSCFCSLPKHKLCFDPIRNQCSSLVDDYKCVFQVLKSQCFKLCLN